MDLSGTVAIVTGGAGHLGSAVTRRLLDAGAHVVACEHHEDKLNALLEELPEGAAVTTVVCDVTGDGDVRELMAFVHEELGGPHALLNIVGGYAGGATVAETDLATWEHMQRLNVTSAFLCCKHALPFMLEADRGRIVMVSSKAAEDLPAEKAAYAVAKAGLLALTQCLAKEVRGTGVSVAAVMPSIIDTPATRAVRPKADPSKWVTPQQIADVLAWLVSGEAQAVNGSVLRLYGALA